MVKIVHKYEAWLEVIWDTNPICTTWETADSVHHTPEYAQYIKFVHFFYFTYFKF